MLRTTFQRSAGALLALAIVIVGATSAGAHPLGSATINHAVAIAVAADGITVDLVVDMAEIPAAQRIGDIDTDGDLDLAPDELAAFAIDDCAARVELLDVVIDGERASGAIVAQTLDPEPGNAGLTTLRLACRFVYQHSVEPGAAHTIEVVNRADQGRSGWREMTATATDISFRATVPSTSPTDLLRSYPDGDPTGPNLTSAEISYGALGDSADAPTNAARADSGSGFAAGDGEVAASPSGRDATDPLTGLLAQADSGMTALMVSLLVAAGIGAAHGLAPGHGKTVIAAYLVGTQGSRRQAVGLATAVAASHTVGVFVLGAVTLLASNRFAPDAIYPTLRLISAVVILGIGLTLLARAVLDRRSADHTHDGLAGVQSSGAGHDHSHNHGDQNHSHGHDGRAHDHDHHDHDHDNHSHDNHGHDHDHHEHDHHDHDHGGHEHLDHDHAHGSGFHVHGIIPHRHRTDWSSIDTSRALGWRTLAGLGLAGGIVPSTSAVLVLLGAVQIGRLDLGAGLVMAFGVGMSIALVSVGLGMVTLARAGGRRFNIGTLSDRWQRVLTPAAAALIIGVGVYLTVVAMRGLS